jgi:hypothetical protein
LARRAAVEDACEQGDGRPRGENRQNDMGDHHETRCALSAEGSGCRLRTVPAGAESEARGSDDETVDRQRKPCPKNVLLHERLCGNEARGFHHGLAATAARSREAGYI